MAKQWKGNRSVQPGTLLIGSKINDDIKCTECGSTTKECKTVAEYAKCNNFKKKKNDKTGSDNSVQR